MAGIDTSVWFRREIGPRLTLSAREILLQWSGLDEKELLPHLDAIRAQAWPLGEYPCIGLWMFLLPGLAAFPQFAQILAHAKRGDGIVLDLGCGLGQDLRLLAVHGVPTTQMWALDVEERLWELGYDLFRDRGRMAAAFIQADFLQLAPTTLPAAKLNVVIAAQFLHLFSWEKQLEAVKKIVDLSSPGTMLVGYQQGRQRAREYLRPWGMMFYHNRESFLRLWDLVQQETRTNWTIEIQEVRLQEWGMQDQDLEWMPEDRMGINFVLIRDL
ncbi:class I SAM-dependent methyltransferase [Aspergillus lucknowensis]|uniref:Methyltransferase domain-containing protein n=1 Tax=Aspergillus lucknowensis TaxID=176173 RepID=A0ABR4LIW7_9EURO